MEISIYLCDIWSHIFPALLLNAFTDNHIQKFSSIDSAFVKKINGKCSVADLNTGDYFVQKAKIPSQIKF